jgi:uncharacterized SAM-binding protein YcdF (DUF218 family)
MASTITREKQHTERLGGWAFLAAVARGLALFFGGFTLLNLLGGLRIHGFDVNLWWIDLRQLPAWLAHLLLVAAALSWLAFAIQPRMQCWRVVSTSLLTLAMLGFTAANAATCCRLQAAGVIHTTGAMPVSAYLAVALLFLGIILLQPKARSAPPRYGCMVVTVFLCAIGFPLAQIYTFGYTDYSRPADIIVVPGARVYADGSLSTAVADRVRTACALYHEGLAPRILFSGGPGDGAITEPRAMRARALRLRVPASAIYLDEHGVDTRATVRNSLPLFHRLGIRRVLVVSHFYHLPRLKMTYGRAGWNVYTVPSRDQRLHASVPYLVTREVAALWAYYLRPLWERG